MADTQKTDKRRDHGYRADVDEVIAVMRETHARRVQPLDNRLRDAENKFARCCRELHQLRLHTDLLQSQLDEAENRASEPTNR